MILHRTTVMVDTHGRESRADDIHQFDFAAYDADMHQFISGCIPPHWHDELEVFVLLSGQVEVVTGDISCIVNAGEGCFINGGVLHTFRALSLGECRYHSFVFESSIVAGAPGSIFDTKYMKPFVEKGHSFVHMKRDEGMEPFFEEFDRCFDACAGEGYAYEFAIRDSLTRMILCIAQNMNAPGDSDMPHLAEVRIKDMLGWIDRNLKDEITVSGIAGSANICVRECQRIFSQYVHYRPMEYVQRRRITLAAELLRTTHRQVTDIALECGFSSVSYFIKQFKNIVGCTPTGYRKNGGDNEK